MIKASVKPAAAAGLSACADRLDGDCRRRRAPQPCGHWPSAGRPAPIPAGFIRRKHLFFTTLRPLHRAPASPAGGRNYRCHCGQPVFFRNSKCLGLQHAAGLRLRTRPAAAADAGTARRHLARVAGGRGAGHTAARRRAAASGSRRFPARNPPSDAAQQQQRHRRPKPMHPMPPKKARRWRTDLQTLPQPLHPLPATGWWPNTTPPTCAGPAG